MPESVDANQLEMMIMDLTTEQIHSLDYFELSLKHVLNKVELAVTSETGEVTDE